MTDEPSGDEIYVAVRRGVRDGLWDVLGGVASVLFGVVLFLVGLGVFSAAVQSAPPAAYALGVLALLAFAGAAYQLGVAMGYRPREWL